MTRVALYTRVSTSRQQQAQTIEQQIERLQAQVATQGWELKPEHIYRDDGYSGAKLDRPALDRLRDAAALGEFDLVLVTAPDRLARNYVHQVIILQELERRGCRVEFLDRPMSQDPHDQLLLQIRGAVAEYERTLITDRMRRGRLAKLRAGTLLPWTRAPYGYRLDPERPRDPQGVHIDEAEAVVIRQLVTWYADDGLTLYQLTKRLIELGAKTPTGLTRWNVSSVRGILTNPSYTGTAYAGRWQSVPSRQRHSPLLPVGRGESAQLRPPEQWIPVAVPALIDQELFDRVQRRLAQNQQFASRNNTQHQYLLRGLVSCGHCRLSCLARTSHPGYPYYACRGKGGVQVSCREDQCMSRYAPTRALDELVWQDLCQVVQDPALIAHALERAHAGAWLPDELAARQRELKRARQQIQHQRDRLLEAYLAGVLELAEFERKQESFPGELSSLDAQERQLEAVASQRVQLSAVAASIEEFCTTIRQGLAQATFTERRHLVELLIDRVVVTDDQVEIRYVLSIGPKGAQTRFCHLRTDYRSFFPGCQTGGGSGWM